MRLLSPPLPSSAPRLILGLLLAIGGRAADAPATAEPPAVTATPANPKAKSDAPAKAVTMDRVVIAAGQLPTGDQPGAVLSMRQITSTPGAMADINRALQMMPGIQLVDEGNALFVRGGNSFETVTRVNGLRYPAAIALESPTGNFSGTLNVFEARRIDFASGGFDARYGNALSGVVSIDTLGKPFANAFTLSAGLGNRSIGADLALGSKLGVRLIGTRTNAAEIFSLNGSTLDYPKPPISTDRAATITSVYRKGGEIKLFLVQRDNDLAVITESEEQTLARTFAQSITNRFGALTWRDTFGALTANVAVGGGSVHRQMSTGTLDRTTKLDDRQVSAAVTYDSTDSAAISVGVEALRERAGLAERAADATVIIPDARLTASRWGGFVKADLSPYRHVRTVLSARLDRSTLTGQLTFDPRLSLAWQARKNIGFMLTGGIYHQVPDPYNLLRGTFTQLGAMRADQVIAGVQFGKQAHLLRLEVYHKTYTHLINLDRTFQPQPGGEGSATGFDAFYIRPLPASMTGRFTYSYVDSERTDPNTGRVVLAPFSIRQTVSVVLERKFYGWTTGLTARLNDGKPFTPIIGGAPNGSGGYRPIYGEPFSARTPGFVRMDLGASHFWRLNGHCMLVTYISVINLLNHHNTSSYSYSPDFSERRSNPSVFNRVVAFGFSLQYY